MCGITGTVTTSDKVDSALVAAMMDRLSHRGPDDAGMHTETHCVLGARRLAIQDVLQGRQPVRNEDGSVIAILNGEIYNFQELRRELIAAGHTLASDSDTEVIPHLYERHGDDFVHHLRGMFAIALWDRRSRKLILVRDRVGKKPLFYTERPDGITFASEIKSFFADPAQPRQPDPVALHLFLSLGAVPAPRTAFCGIRSLPPAHRLVYAGGRTRIDRYWNPYPSETLAVDLPEAADLVRDAVRGAVRRRMQADVPVGAFLSGGVDSACVVACMVQERNGPVRTFTMGVAAHPDERESARRVARLLGTEHTENVISEDALNWLPDLVRQYDQPFADSSVLPTYAVARAAREHVTVALNGDGGDEAFLGYRRTFEMWKWLQLDERARSASSPPLPSGRSSMGVGSLSAGRRAELRDSGDTLDSYGAWLFNFDDEWLRLAYQPAFAELTKDVAAGSLLRERASAGHDDLSRLAAVDAHLYLPDVLLTKVDMATMAVSLEARSPFLDQEVIELALALPSPHKLDDSGGKRVLREAFRGLVPDGSLDAPKRGFGVPLDDWLRTPIGRSMTDVLLDPAAQLTTYLRPERIRHLVEEHQSRRAAHGNRLYSLLCLELWLQTFIAAAPPGPSGVLVAMDLP
jgi:asparagine synthase (glutamine-hydrolysing)